MQLREISEVETLIFLSSSVWFFALFVIYFLVLNPNPRKLKIIISAKIQIPKSFPREYNNLFINLVNSFSFFFLYKSYIMSINVPISFEVG